MALQFCLVYSSKSEKLLPQLAVHLSDEHLLVSDKE